MGPATVHAANPTKKDHHPEPVGSPGRTSSGMTDLGGEAGDGNRISLADSEGRQQMDGQRSVRSSTRRSPPGNGRSLAADLVQARATTTQTGRDMRCTRSELLRILRP